ncbi:MAG TPA: hypothetical protein PLZ74_08025, partial [Kiritimatiellia bacterium]|nr:hypothetical protein [Kiritimatiellia bacterium]
MKSRLSFDSCFISAWTFAVAAFCFQMGAQAQTSVSLYKGPITGSSPENPVDFSVTSYWDPAGMPSGTTAEAKFAKATMGTLTEQMYVALPNNLTLLTLRAGGGKIINFIGENVSLGTLHYHDYLGYASVLYATAHAFGNDISSVCGAFAGDVVNAISGKMVFAGGEVEHHHHCYANSDSETILNALPTNFWTHGSANLHLYASRQCGEVTGLWKATKDSKHLKYVGASAIHVVAPGAKVTCPGIVPTGAYVRRWFSNAKTIELSAAALDNADSTNLTFHAYNPSVRQDVVTWQKQGGAQNAILNKWSTGQNAVLEVDTLQGGSADAITFDAEGNCYPWRVIIHNGKILSAVNFKYADIEFADNPSGVRGLPNSAVSVTSSSKSSTVTVPGGENTAYFKTFGPIAAGGGLIKKGAGALVAKLGDDLFGSLEVAEGSVSFTNAVDTAKIYELGSLTLGAGTVFNVDGGVTLNVKMISVGTGARITGTGTIAFPNLSMIPEGVIASSVKIGIAGVSGGLVHGEIVPAVVGDPAFWLDTAAADSLVTEENGAVTNVVRWNDCRKASPDDGYMFATNCWAKPTLANMLIQNYTHRSEGARINSFNRNYVRIVANPASLAHCEALVWSRKLTGIKSVFLVMSAADGGGCVLGNTAKLGDFGRGATGQAAIFYSGTDASPEKVYKAPMYINGVKVVNHFTFGPYTGFPNNWRPFLFEVHPTADGGEADAFGMQGTNRLDLAGGQRIFECILYTNELTRTEQAQVADYLTRKWFNACYGGAYALDEAEETIDATTFDRLDIVSGDYAVEAITGTSFVKTGAGGMYVASLTGGTDLTIPEGSMVISSAKAASFANLPVDDSGVYMHLDANNLEGSTMSEIDGKGECVKIWKSLRGATLRTATNFSTNHPALKTTGGSARMKDGMKYVDLGEFREVPTTTGYGTVNANCGETYHFMKSDGIRAMFMVFGGTGPLVGNNGIYQNYGEGGLYRGDNAAA